MILSSRGSAGTPSSIVSARIDSLPTTEDCSVDVSYLPASALGKALIALDPGLPTVPHGSS